METTSAESFLRELGNAFARNGLGPRGATILVLLAGAVLGVIVSGLVRRAFAHRADLERFAARHALTAADVQLVRAVAARARFDPLHVLTRLDLFERATALVLADAPAGSAGDLAPRISHLRQALRFDRLPAHAPLLSTRELSAGTAVAAELGDGLRRGVVLGVDERTWRVEVDGPVDLLLGDEAGITIVHARDAHHAVRCRVLDRVVTDGGATHLSLAHDEAPRRLQRREYVRVSAAGAIAIRPLLWPVTPPGPRPEIAARIVDVSGGGLHVRTEAPLAVGLLAELRFDVAGEEFRGLRAAVLSCEAVEGGHEARLELKGVPERERERLTAAVARTEARERQGAAPG
jgi:c-di-GMP-binding flagellar brake protein YcgR